MQWIECRVHTTHAAHELIAQLFITHGANGTVLEDSRGKDFTPEPWTDIIGKPKTEHLPTDGVVVKAYFPDDGTLEATLSAVKKDLVQLEATTNQPVAQTEILLTTVHEEDWAEAWKAYYKPVQVSETMSIVRLGKVMRNVEKMNTSSQWTLVWHLGQVHMKQPYSVYKL